MAHPDAYGIIVTVRDDSSTTKTVIVRDASGTEIGSLVIDVVPKGVRVEGWNADDTMQAQMVLHR